MGRRGIEVVVSELEREQLLSMSRSRSLPHSLVRRAKIVLMAADGYTTKEIAMQCEVTPPAITHWKKRFVAQGLAGLHDEAAQADHAHMTTRRSRNYWPGCCMKSRTGQRTGACVLRPRRQGFRRVRLPGICRCSVYSPIVQRASSCLLIHSSSRRYAILSGCT